MNGLSSLFGDYLPTLLIGVFIVLVAPWKRASRFVLERHLAASPEAVWSVIADWTEFDVATEARPPSKRFDHMATKRLSESPEVYELVYDRSKGKAKQTVSLRCRILERDPYRTFSVRFEARGGVAFPLGPESFHRVDLTPGDDGVQIVYTDEIRTNTLLQRLLFWWGARERAREVAHIVATGRSRKQAPPSRFARPRLQLVLAAASVAGFALAIGSLFGALLLCAIIFVHELGHGLAMRLTGQPSAKILMIPLFGGVAIPAKPHASKFADAFCALMGPGFSALICAALMLAWRLGVSAPAENAIELGREAARAGWPLACLALANGIAFINVWQLAPVLPLDGGHIFRALLEKFGQRAMRIAMFVLALAAVMISLWSHLWVFALIAVLGLMGLMATRAVAAAVNPMSKREAVAIALGYGAVAIILTNVLVAPGLSGSALAFFRSPNLDVALDSPPEQTDSTPSPRYALAGSFTLGNPETAQAFDEKSRPENRRVWGAPDKLGPFGFIEVRDFTGYDARRPGRGRLRRNIDEYLDDFDVDVTYDRSPKAAPFDGAYGIMDSLTLTLSQDDVAKSCRAFHGFAGRGAAYVFGMACRDGAKPPSVDELACMARGLRIDPIAPTNFREPSGCGRDTL